MKDHEGRVNVRAARECARARRADSKQWAQRLVENGAFEDGMYDVFEGLQKIIDMDWRGMGYCVGCVAERREAWTALREKLWDELDVFLGLKGEEEEKD